MLFLQEFEQEQALTIDRGRFAGCGECSQPDRATYGPLQWLNISSKQQHPGFFCYRKVSVVAEMFGRFGNARSLLNVHRGKVAQDIPHSHALLLSQSEATLREHDSFGISLVVEIRHTDRCFDAHTHDRTYICLAGINIGLELVSLRNNRSRS